MEKIALIFPGQGSQYIGMCKHLCEQYDVACRTFEEANDILGFNLKNLCLEGSLVELSAIENVLPAIFTASVVTFRVYMKEVGIYPQFLAGHSLGEYSALCCSGAMRFADALNIVRKRALLAKEITDQGIGAMVIISNVDVAMIEEECKAVSNNEKFAAISCYNSSNEVAVSGHLEAVQMVEDRAIEVGALVTPLIGVAPFHCPLMRLTADVLREELRKYTYGSIKWPVVSNVTASVYEGPEKIVDYLTDQIMAPVKWRQIMDYLQYQGVTLTIEMGPKNVLSNLFKLYPGIKKMVFDHKEDRKELFESFGKQWEYRKLEPAFISKCLAISIATPNTNFDQEQYRQGVVEPYRKLRSIQQELGRTGDEPGVMQIREAFGLLKTILTTKGVSAKEQSYWYYQIFDETGTHYLLRNQGYEF